jgi:hypothetical protein
MLGLKKYNCGSTGIIKPKESLSKSNEPETHMSRFGLYKLNSAASMRIYLLMLSTVLPKSVICCVKSSRVVF